MGWHWGILAASGAGAAGAYEHIQSTILTGSQASVTFSNLNTYPEYKHLQIRMVVHSTATTNGVDLRITLNGDTGANYSRHQLRGDGTTVTSTSSTSASFIALSNAVDTDSGGYTNFFAPAIIDILDFSSTSKNTTLRTLHGRTSVSYIALNSGAWYNTNAVTSLTITPQTAQLSTGSRFSLYGIKG